ncbi:MAG: carbon-nitrogen hydrolase family protein [Candidatus Hydrogenedentes bacterium]|nr:carbon-nitrogen hydrolase family protein [Candidatus Hydrogenedentota bacterium]
MMRTAICVLTALVLAIQVEATGNRNVRIVSIGFSARPVAQFLDVVKREAAKGADLIVLPETCTGNEKPEAVDGPAIQAMQAVAREHKTYVVCPIDRMKGTTRLNTAVLIDRAGSVAGMYDKVYPYFSEYDLKPPVTPGTDVPVFDTDFGKLGIAICFDVNFPDVWQQLADKGAEIVVWPSAYSAGSSLQAHALNHHFYIVTSTLLADCIVYDITGELLLSEKRDDINVSRITLDLDRGIYHQNFNMDGRDRLLKEHTGEVAQEKWLDKEQWFVLRSTKPGASARALAKEYGMTELRDYKSASRKKIDAMRQENVARSAK